MIIATKKSHCFSLAVGSGVAAGLWFPQMVFASSNGMDSLEVLFMLFFQLLAGVLAGVSFDLVWKHIEHETANGYDKPRAYTPDVPVLLGLAFVVAALTMTFCGAAPLAPL